MTGLLGLSRRMLRLNKVATSCVNTSKWRFLSSRTAAQTKSISENDNEDLWIRSPFPDIEIPENVTLHEFLRSSMGPWGNEIAFECASTRRKYTHNQTFAMGRSFGAALIQSGLKKGDCVAIILLNEPEYASVIYGAWEAGLVVSTVNPNYTRDEILRQLKVCKAKAVITSSQYIRAVRSSQNSGECPDLKSIILIDEKHEGCHTFSEMAKVDPRSVKFPSPAEFNTKQDTALLPYSSGTTGLPKGVMLTHYNLVANLLQVTIPQMVHRPRLGNPYQERFFAVLPFFHAYGLVVYLSLGMYFGAHTVCLQKYEAEMFLAEVRRHKPTTLHVVTPLLSHMANSPDYGKEELASVEMVISGAAPVGPNLINKFLSKAEKYIIYREGYGMTELSPVSHMVSPLSKNKKIGSVGQTVPNTVTKIVDVATGKTLGRNERGEICVKGPQVMKGYFNNDEATRNTIDPDGWLHTGDIGYFDEEGYCYIVDRLKELIKVKGFQVAPSELEDLLRSHPLVTDVAVIGVPNEEWGELPRAYIVRENDSLTTESVHLHLQEKVASFKRLRGGIEFVEEIPKSAAGKILRRELIKAYKEQNGIPL